jgi:hypothetical protein
MRLLLVHGMGRTPLSMARLARYLRQQGHRAEGLGYVAALESFSRIQRRVRSRLDALADSGEQYAVIGHSLGGLALRAALQNVDPLPRCCIMLGTPNQPPRLARRLHRRWIYRLLCGESGQLLARPDFFRRLPIPPVPYTIIAGNAGPRGPRSPFGNDPNDWLVAVEETKILPGDRPLVLAVGHTFMMNQSPVQLAVRETLERYSVRSDHERSRRPETSAEDSRSGSGFRPF